MELDECLTRRTSVIKYKSAAVEFEKIIALLDAASFAPSSGNLQNWRFIVIEDHDKKSKIALTAFKQYWMVDAPVLIVVCSDQDSVSRYYSERGTGFYAVQNCAAAIENMLLKAVDMGLGGCWVSAFDEITLRRDLRIPENIKPQGILAFGYPLEEGTLHKPHPIEGITYFEEWGKKREFSSVFPLQRHVMPKEIEKKQNRFFSKLFGR